MKFYWWNSDSQENPISNNFVPKIKNSKEQRIKVLQDELNILQQENEKQFMQIFTPITKDAACAKIYEFADEAEDGNYHNLATCLREICDCIYQYNIKGMIPIIKSTNEYPQDNNIIILNIV